MIFRDTADDNTHTFNVENELVSVSNNGTFACDTAGIRVKTVRPGGKTSYFPFPGYEEEVNGSTTTRRITYSIAGQAVALRVQVVSGSNTLYYLHTDHLGSTSLATTTGGAVISGSTSRYYPFGNWRTEPTANLTDRGFTGHLHNNLGNAPDDIGLVYMQARWYLPYINRFISADTIVPNPTNPQQYNRYSYALNNALKYIDPSGHNVDCSPVAGDCPPSPPKPIKVKKNALDRLIQVNTWTNQMLLWPITSVGAGTIQIHNSFSHMLETVPKPAALTANKVSAGLAIATGMFSQAEIVQRTQNGELTSNQAWKQTGVNGLSTATTTYLGAGGMATGATTLTGTLQGTTILGTPVVSAASPVVLTVVGVTSLAYVAPIAQGTANNMIEGQSFLPAFLDARSNFHHAVIGEELSVRLDEQIEFFAGPVIRGIGDTIIWGGNKLQKVGSQGP
ncbi:MAG: hypothetical protein BroJett015_45680 [Chloroflexota bacterium]|nr:MAG: hypothetical protein BroJett015_45680 [Chloroflexota bacterium]